VSLQLAERDVAAAGGVAVVYSNLAATNSCAESLVSGVFGANERARQGLPLTSRPRHCYSPPAGWLPGRRSCKTDGGVLRVFVLCLSSRRQFEGRCCTERSPLAPICSPSARSPSPLRHRSAHSLGQPGLCPPDTAACCLFVEFLMMCVYSCRGCGWN
jgi:hypothetical protein